MAKDFIRRVEKKCLKSRQESLDTVTLMYSLSQTLFHHSIIYIFGHKAFSALQDEYIYINH